MIKKGWVGRWRGWLLVGRVLVKMLVNIWLWYNVGYRRVSSWMKKYSPSYGQNHQLVHWWVPVHSGPSQGHCTQSPHWDYLWRKKSICQNSIPRQTRYSTSSMLSTGSQSSSRKAQTHTCNFGLCVVDWWNTDPAWIWSVLGITPAQLDLFHLVSVRRNIWTDYQSFKSYICCF